MSKSETPGRGVESAIVVGLRHLRNECGRWWRAEDLTDTHIAHRILNDQYRLWRQQRQRFSAEVQQNMSMLKAQQKQATYMQMQRIAMQKRSRGYGYGYGGGMGGASPMVSYRMMQWAQMQMRLGQEEFRHLEVTDQMLVIGRGQVRSRRHLAAAAWVLVLAALWLGVWWLSALAGLVVTAAAAAVLAGVAWGQGRRPTRRRPPVPKLLFVPPKAPAHADMDADPEPFPIREAGRDPRTARESVRLALKKEGAKIAEVRVPTEADWGWTVPMVLGGGTIADLVRVLPGVATTLRVGTNRLLAQQSDPEDSAAVTLRVLTSDPFAADASSPVSQPRSRSITTPVSLGRSIDGDPTPVVLAGQHVLIVASSGGGKSALVRRLAEAVTACTDAVAVDVDPMGRGLGPLRSCAARTAYTAEDIERTLEDLLRRAHARIAALDDTDDNHPVSEDAPAIVVFADEFRRLTARAKQIALRLLEVGRKARVTLVICTTDATADASALSDAIADALGVRILMPCRSADVPLVVGQSDAIAKGWLPHVLVPSPGEWEPADAGQFYCITPRSSEPLLRYAPLLSAAAAAEAAAARVAAGLPSIDGTPSRRPTIAADAEQLPAIGRALLAAFTAAGSPDWLTLAQLADRLAADDPVTWGRWEGRDDRLIMVGRTLRAELRRAGLDIPRQRLDAETDAARPTVYRLADIEAALTA
ncbi:hypothetical protein [Streptomyces sp. NPDC048516]|uniref:hypothetical protein n=1 Tax=Streptomyces sp. NPDC048516 TaxID=3365565 RepID=UPI003724A16F